MKNYTNYILYFSLSVEFKMSISNEIVSESGQVLFCLNKVLETNELKARIYVRYHRFTEKYYTSIMIIVLYFYILRQWLEFGITYNSRPWGKDIIQATFYSFACVPLSYARLMNNISNQMQLHCTIIVHNITLHNILGDIHNHITMT